MATWNACMVEFFIQCIYKREVLFVHKKKIAIGSFSIIYRMYKVTL
jgi:hypothetical protein